MQTESSLEDVIGKQKHHISTRDRGLNHVRVHIRLMLTVFCDAILDSSNPDGIEVWESVHNSSLDVNSTVSTTKQTIRA